MKLSNIIYQATQTWIDLHESDLYDAISEALMDTIEIDEVVSEILSNIGDINSNVAEAIMDRL